jgi:hypothetical protein
MSGETWETWVRRGLKIKISKMKMFSLNAKAL